jgi:hypothetical protein
VYDLDEMRAIGLLLVGSVAFALLAMSVWREEQPAKTAVAVSQPQTANPYSRPAPVLVIATPDPNRDQPCDAFLRAVPLPPGVDLAGAGLLHAVLFARQEIAPIWSTLPDERERMGELLDACIATTSQPLLFPR